MIISTLTVLILVFKWERKSESSHWYNHFKSIGGNEMLEQLQGHPNDAVYHKITSIFEMYQDDFEENGTYQVEQNPWQPHNNNGPNHFNI